MMKILRSVLILVCLFPMLGQSAEKSSGGGFWSSVKETGGTIWGGMKDGGKRMKDGWDGKEPDKPLPEKGDKREGLQQWNEK